MMFSGMYKFFDISNGFYQEEICRSLLRIKRILRRKKGKIHGEKNE